MVSGPFPQGPLIPTNVISRIFATGEVGMKRRWFTFHSTAILLIFVIGTASARVADATNDMSWLDGFTLVVLEKSNSELTESEHAARLHAARSVIQSHGGRVAIMSPPSYIMGWVPFEYRSELIGKAGIKDIFYTNVRHTEVGADDTQSRLMVNYYNAVVRGDVQRELLARASRPVQEWPSDRVDALRREPLDEAFYLENLRAAGLDVEELKAKGKLVRSTPFGAAGNSDAMTGTISLTLFFAESNGAIDPDTYTWTDQHVQDYVAGTNTGLAWWTMKSYENFDCWNAFFVRFEPPANCQQAYEPVLHSSGFTSTWVSLVMSNFGYNTGTNFARVEAFNTWQRVTYGTNWAYSAFIAYNPPPAPDRFTNGTSAFAYLLGPYTVLLYRSYSWPVDQVLTHETGHIFGACDEYNGSSCNCTNCLGKQNQNCYLCGSGSCMMKSNTFNLCAWTPGQLGWSGMSCAPAPLASPAPSSSAPATGVQGATMTTTVIGSNFLYGAEVGLGPDVTVNSTTYINSTTLLADITIGNEAPPAFVDVTVTNRDLQSATLVGGFEIQRSAIHYASPTGGNVFPYLSPAEAATTLQDAVDAAGDGDSLLVETNTYSGVNLNIFDGVMMYGAWNSGFTARDLAFGKTVINLNGTVTINATAPVVIDGFVLENGEGNTKTLPIAGDYGGALYALTTTFTIANCELRTNVLSQGGSYSAGGAIYASGCAVDVHDNTIAGNGARQGGAIYLDNCSGTVDGNVIMGNQLQFGPEAPLGGAVHIANSSSVAFSNNTIDGNSTNDGVSSSAHGGAFYISGSTGISIFGGSISGNSTGASSNGGAVHIVGSDVSITSATISQNQSTLFGGAVSCEGGSSVSISGVEFHTNAALLGGGAYMTNSDAFVEHNLFVGNSASLSGGGCYLLQPTDGSFVGNTMDLNTASTGGGVIFSNAAIPVLNNIIVNSGGDGVNCSGATPTFSYNDVWNSSGADYSGCAAGPGSISADPLFADAPLGDYHLAMHSPAIDAGDPDPAWDDPDGSRGDMGSYGSHALAMEQPVYPKNLMAAVQFGDVVLTWDANPEPDVASYAIYKDSLGDFQPSLDSFIALTAAPDSMYNAGPAVDSCYYKISAVDNDGYASGYSIAAQATPATGIGDDVLSYGFRLHQNRPNPFNPVTEIRYEISEPTHVRLSVYDVRGGLVTHLADRAHVGGTHSVIWNGTNQNGRPVSSGIYFYRLVAGNNVITRKMVMLK
jgi:hypothetical protein